MDPLADKYYQISPFVFVANNPLKFIDPDGRKIVFTIFNDNGSVANKLTYSNGNFWHENGSRYNPQKESLSPTLYKTLSAYRKIESSGDKVLKKQLTTLQNGPQVHTIKESKEKGRGSGVIPQGGKDAGETVDMVNNGTPVGSNAIFDLSSEAKSDLKDVEGIGFSDFSIIVHEMQHQYDFDQGNSADDQYPNTAKDPSEIRAVKNENRARKIEGSHKRTTYGGKKIDPNKLK